MTSISLPAWLRAALLAMFIPALCSCGEGTVTFAGGDDDDDDDATVSVEGNLDDVTPVTGREIVVFVYDIDDSEDDHRCPCPTAPDPDITEGKAIVLTSGETEFTITGIDAGPIGIVFLLDNSGDNADGQIDPGDQIAVLDDVDCELDDVEGNVTITLEDIDIQFYDYDPVPTGECTDGSPPTLGRARADQITLVRSTTN